MKIIYDPAPRTAAEMFSNEDFSAFMGGYDVVTYDGGDRDAFYDAHLPDCDILVSQQPMGADRLAKASNLKAIFNVETNFLPNIDYEACFQRGIHVLAPSGVFALAVAEMGLGMAISLARGIHSEHARFLDGTERYGLEGNGEAELLTGSQFGFIGFGDLGKALQALLPAFRPAAVRVFDPWLPDGHLARLGVPRSLGREFCRAPDGERRRPRAGDQRQDAVWPEVLRDGIRSYDLQAGWSAVSLRPAWLHRGLRRDLCHSSGGSRAGPQCGD